MIALDDCRHDSDNVVLWTRDEDAVKYTGASGRLPDYLRQAGPFHWQLIQVPSDYDRGCLESAVQFIDACFDIFQESFSAIDG